MGDVLEHAIVNKVFKDLMDSGPGAIAKLESRVQKRWTVRQILMEVLDGVMDNVGRKARMELKEKKRLEWELRWEALELELATEMDILMELEMNRMDVEEYAEEKMEYEDWEDIINISMEILEEEEYEEWLAKERESCWCQGEE